MSKTTTRSIGSFGKVKIGTHKPTGMKVAIKIVDKIHAPALVREIETWRQLKHPNIVHLYDVLCTETKIYMVTEYCPGGEAFDYIVKNGKLGETAESKRICRQIVEAVGHCHEKGLSHRDLKLENIVLTDDLDVKLIDFGFTTSFENSPLLETYCGSSAYASPEIIQGKKYSGPETDCWSLVVGELPFDDDNDLAVHKKIIEVEYTYPDGLSEDFYKLIDGVLQKDPKDRLTIEGILNHPWMACETASKIPEKTLDSDPDISELVVAAKLNSVGIDVNEILNSVHRNSCDALSALWHLLIEKEKANPTRVFNESENTYIKIQLDSNLFNDITRTASENPLLLISRKSAIADSHSPLGTEANCSPVRTKFPELAPINIPKARRVSIQDQNITTRRNVFQVAMKPNHIPSPVPQNFEKKRPKSAQYSNESEGIAEEEEFF